MFEHLETLSSSTHNECGHTRLEREEWEVTTTVFGGSLGEKRVTIRLYRCIREPDHVGEHYGVEVKPEGEPLLWTDTPGEDDE